MLEFLELVLATILVGGFFGFLILAVCGTIATFVLAIYGSFKNQSGVDHDV
jgi:hypothetical protein